MGTLFQAFGILALVGLVLVVVVVAVIVWKVKRFFRGLAGAATPETIELKPASSLEWDDEDTAQKQTAQLVERGFLDAGSYTIPSLGGVVMRGFVKPADGSVAVVYEHPAAGVIVDVVTRYPDRTAITVTSAGETGLDAMPGKTKVNMEGAEAAALYDRMLSERPPDKTPRRIAATEFAPFFERAYAEEMAWRKGRGGPTKDEIRRVAAKSGRPVTDAQVDEAQVRLRPKA